MNRITEVELDGFKGQHRTVELGARTVLSGPNGLGKSAILEAVRYALSGEVPSGRTLDEVAKYFPDRGGHVTVTDAAGNFISRGIERDHEKQKISEILEQGGDVEWHCNEALLDMQGFLALSPNKRREFVLDLVGAGETPNDTEIHTALARDYARQIGGPGADVSILDGRLDDLPAEIRPLAGRWLALWEVFSSYLQTGEKTASAIFQRLAEVARERKNLSRRMANEAKAASRELKAAMKGARAAAAELEKRRYEAEAAADAFGEAREQAARREQAREAVERESRDLMALGSRLELCDTAVVEDPGERTALDTSPSEEANQLRAEANAVQARADEVTAQYRKLENARDYLSASSGVLKQVTDELETSAAEPIGRASKLSEKILTSVWPDAGAFPVMSTVIDLLDVVDELAESWKVRREKTAVRLAECAISVRHAEEKHAELKTCTDTEAYLADLEREIDEIEEKAFAFDRANLARIEAEKDALKAWETKTNRATEVHTAVRALKERHEATTQRHLELTEKLAAMPDPAVRTLQEDVLAAKEALQEAEEAAGAVAAYEDAVRRAEDEKVSEKAWRAAETACKHARESYVAEVAKPLVDDMAALLHSAGRTERVYLRLENERRKPVFDLGWTLGDSRRSLSALSGGEAVLFTTALALTIARRSGGRRVLLIEADPLDEKNLGELLKALMDMEAELDACLVATTTTVPAADGWKCVQFGRGGSLEIDGYISCSVIEESELEHGEV